MRVKKNRLGIREVFEVRISQDLWLKIRRIAWQNRLTYSAVVRLCLFQQKSRSCHTAQKIRQTRKTHRHMLCLYGKDAGHLRNLASHAGLTLSAFIRRAVEKNIDSLENEISGELVRTAGIKIRKALKFLGMTNGLCSDMEFHISSITWEHHHLSEIRPWRGANNWFLATR